MELKLRYISRYRAHERKRKREKDGLTSSSFASDIQGVLKRYVKTLRRYSSHLKNEKMLYGHRCGNVYSRSYVENTISCITYTRKNLGLIIVDDNRLIRLIYIWF